MTKDRDVKVCRNLIEKSNQYTSNLIITDDKTKPNVYKPREYLTDMFGNFQQDKVHLKVNRMAGSVITFIIKIVCSIRYNYFSVLQQWNDLGLKI